MQPRVSDAMGPTGQLQGQRAVRHKRPDERQTNLSRVSVPCQDEVESGEDELADNLGRVHQSDGTNVALAAFEMVGPVTAEIGVVCTR